MAGVATIAKFLDATPDATPASSRAWTPAPQPTEDELLRDKRRWRLQQLRRALSALAHPVTTGRHFRPRGRQWTIAGRPLPATSLDRLVGPDRNLALIRSSLKLIKGVAHTADATVNDVLLTVTAGGLSGLLNSRGEPIEGSVTDLRTRLVAPGAMLRRKSDRADGRPAPDRGLRSCPEAKADRQGHRSTEGYEPAFPRHGAAPRNRRAGFPEARGQATRRTAPTSPARRRCSISPGRDCWRCSRWRG